MNLDAWQSSLEKHFEALSALKRASAHPLFALEHGLTGDAIEQLRIALAEHLVHRPVDRRHWLCWAAYATEVGYEYQGDEYWPLLEERLPRWREQGSRPQIQACFKKFANIYGGVQPSGPWADYFSIISWPVTHAILPRYLQLQFANTLFVLRHRLASLKSLDAAAIGQVVAESATGVSTRFEEFLQQRSVAGTIVLSVLSEKHTERTPLTEEVLRRIVADLEQERAGKAWLADTRKVVASRFRLSGIQSGPRTEGNRDETETNSEFRPRLLLRPSPSHSWSVIAEIPSLSGLARSSDEMRAIIEKSRCKLAGGGDEWLPAGWLARYPQKRKLVSWPPTDATLVTYEKTSPLLSMELNRKSRLATHPPWLFKIAADGYGRQVLSRVVQRGRSYIIVAPGPIEAEKDLVTHCAMDCVGVFAAEVRIPQNLLPSQQAVLERLGLIPTALLEIYPVGLPSIARPSEDTCEWLTTDEPAFALRADCPLRRVTIRLGGQTIFLPSSGKAWPMFRLEPLPSGVHELSISAEAERPVHGSQSELKGKIRLVVREPEPWTPGFSSHAGLTVLCDPPAPSLDHYLTGDLEVIVLGPEGRRVTVGVSLYNALSRPIAEEAAQSCALPLKAERWRQLCEVFLKKQSDALQEAAAAKLSIRAEELGTFVLRLERRRAPLRWVYRRKENLTELRLVDDTGHEHTDGISLYSDIRPWEREAVSRELALLGFQPEHGGLVVAQSGAHRADMAFTLLRRGVDLNSLMVLPDPVPASSNPVAFLELQKARRVWRGAQVAGPLAKQQRQSVVDGFESALVGAVCGSDWRARENLIGRDAPSLSELRCLQSLVGQPSLAAALARNFHTRNWNDAEMRHWFHDCAKRYDVCDHRRSCDLALQWARFLPDLSPSEFDQARSYPKLFRSARFLYWLYRSLANGASRQEAS